MLMTFAAPSEVVGIEWPSLRLVDAPDDTTSTATRAELNGLVLTEAGDVRVHAIHDGFSLGASTLGGTPGARGRSWGPNKLPFSLKVEGPRTAAAAVLTALSQALARDGWLRFQQHWDAAPRWARVYAGGLAALDWTWILEEASEDLWTVPLALDTDPFMVGAPVTLGPFTVTNDPKATGSGVLPMVFDVPAVSGGDLTPAAVRVARGSSGGLLGLAVGVSSLSPFTVDGANWSSTLLGAASSDSGWVGGSVRESTVQLSTDVTDWRPLATFTPPSDSPAGPRRVAVQVEGSTDSGAVDLRLVVSSPSAVASVAMASRTVALKAGSRSWVQVGTVPFPLTNGAALGLSPTTVLTLQARRTPGSGAGGNLRIGPTALLTGATDSTLRLVQLPAAAASAASSDVLLDGDAAAVTAAAAGNLLPTPDGYGGWPMLSPHGTNHVFVAQQYDQPPVSGAADSKSATTSVTVTYRPRYLLGVG